VRVAFISWPYANSFPPANSFAIWTAQVARRLASTHDIVIYAPRGPTHPRIVKDGELEYRLIRATEYHSRLSFLKPYTPWRLKNETSSNESTSPGEPNRKPFFSSFFFFAGYNVGIASSLLRERFDIVHIHNMSQLVPAVHSVSPKSAIVLHMHSYWLSELDQGMVRKRLRHVDRIVSCSGDVTERICQAFPEVADRCHTIHNGVDLDLFAPDGQAAVRGRLITLGRISPEKGQHVLLDALARIGERYPDVELEVVGPYRRPPRDMVASISDDPLTRSLAPLYISDYMADLRDQAERQAVNVSFAGEVTQHEAAGRLRASSVLIAPSITDTFSMPVAEAMATGLPVVASDVGGPSELVLNGETGLLVPPGDPVALAEAIARLLDDPKLRERMGAAGRRRAQELFSWDRIAHQLSCVYEKK